MIRKLVATIALLTGLFALVGPAAPASAGGPTDYADCVVTLSDTTLEPGQEVQVSGSGFQDEFETDIIFDLGEDSEEVLATVTTDNNGEFGPITVTIPEDAAPGEHTISTLCDSDSVNNTTIEVLGDEISRGPLPTTGSDVEPLVVAGGVAIVAGLAFVLVAQRRRKASATT
jgi:LPXTG-motif cell wall-anchored protein